MAADDRKGRKAIFTGDDLPNEAAIPSGEPMRGDDNLAFERDAPEPRGLDLDDGDRLPWLESADDIDADEGFDGGRIIGFLILGLLALAMIVGAVWFATNRTERTEAGGVIRADKGPYKVAPENPGGKTFEGTGDTSYAVAQGQSRSGTVGGSTPAPAQASPAPLPSATASPAPSAAAAPTPAAAQGGVGVQIGAYTSAADAEKGWATLSGRHDALSGFAHRVVEGQADFGRVFRLQAVAPDAAAAGALCDKLRTSGQGCQVKR
jgi:hypothetical protein